MSFLNKGDTIGIIAPSSGLQDKDLKPALDYFKKLELKVKLADNLTSEYRYMAGTDNERAKNINKMFADKEIRALFCIRGGAGSTRLLNMLDYNIIQNNPKPIIGLSDSTALQNALFAKANIPSLTGFLPLYDFNNKDIDNLVDNSLKTALFSNSHQIISGNYLINGSTNGILVGGCLSVLCYLCGTQYFPDLNDKILLLEDIGEKTYKIDLMLNQLKQQKNFNKLKGIVLGKFTDCTISSPEDGSIEDCIKDFTTGLNIPIITDFNYGHIPSRYVLPLGISVNITAEKNTCTLSW
ncbi:MAG: LD-carboxypeptidase [Acetobacter sp.]|nr:LD-carboxypeptidase [Acetobacter sp.]